jgi:23S rRNA (uracil1939-C5)-methyltransferase
VERCVILCDALQRGLTAVRHELTSKLSGPGELRLALGEGQKPVAHFECEQPQRPDVYATVEALVVTGSLAGASLRVARAGTPATWGDPREHGTGADGEPLIGPIGGFSQAHATLNHALARAVHELAEVRDSSVLELYAGTGNFSVLLAREAGSFVAVEADPNAADACRGNLRSRALTARVMTVPVESYNVKTRPSVIVLDPPRTGARDAIPSILSARPKRIVYVSCDPPTLARDLRELEKGGFRADHALAFDMFPQSAHVEAVVRLLAVDASGR